MIQSLLVALLVLAALAAAALVGFSAWVTRRVNAAVPPVGRFIDIAGQRIHYTDQGHGPPILLIHGLGGQMRNFPPPLIDGLARRFRVIAFDRPGSGHSTRPLADPANPRHQAATIAAFAHRLGLQRPLLVGHSLGGALALAVALDHPALPAGLALIAPLTQAQQHVPEPFRALVTRSRWLRLLIAWTLAVPASMRRGAETLALVFAPDPVPRDYATAGGGLLALRPSSYYGASTDLVAVNDDMPALMQRYHTLSLPVAILFGTADHILDPAIQGARAAAAIPGAAIEWIEGGGHMIPVIDPTRTQAFIERLAARVAAEPVPA